MAIKLGAKDTHIVLTALWDYRDTLTNAFGGVANPETDSVDRLIKSYTKSFLALDRLGVK